MRRRCASLLGRYLVPKGSLAAFVSELGMRDVLFYDLFILYVLLLLATKQQQHSSPECKRFGSNRSPENKQTNK